VGGRRLAAAAAACCCLALGRARAGTPFDETETWSGGGTAGWTNDEPSVTLTNPAGFLELRFAAQGAPGFVADVVRRPLEPGTLLTNLALRLAAVEAPPSRAQVCLHSRLTGNTWTLRLAAPAAGAQVDDQVAFQYAAGWSMGPHGTEAAFQADLRTADWVGVRVRRHSNPAAQRYRLDDVRIQGVRSPEDRDVDGMDDAWETGFGLDPDDPRDADEDRDGDGMSNYAEARAGTDPNDAGSRFVLRIRPALPGDEPHVVLEWTSLTNRTYAIWRSEGLDQPFLPVRTGILATPSLNEYEDPALGAGFYRVVVEP